MTPIREITPPTWRKPMELALERAYFDAKLRTASDDELRRECNNCIWLSAFASNNIRSDYHWMADATYDGVPASRKTGDLLGRVEPAGWAMTPTQIRTKSIDEMSLEELRRSSTRIESRDVRRTVQLDRRDQR